MVALKPTRPALLAAALASAMGGCGSCGDGAVTADGGATTASAAPTVAPPSGRVAVDLVDILPSCDIEHRGLLFDAGGDPLLGRTGWRWGAPAGVESTEHDGATWARLMERKIELSFVLAEPSPIFVAVRGIGRASKSAVVLLDDQRLGDLSFNRDEIRIATTDTTSLPVDRGAHTLTLRFIGRAKDAEAFAEIDWIRVGMPDDDATTYGAPTLRDLVSPAAAIGNIPHRAIALRAPGAVRCPLRPPKGGRVRVALGLQGAGEGEAELGFVRDGMPTIPLGTFALAGGDQAVWKNVEIPLPPEPAAVGALELRANAAPRGARVLFGDPALTLTSAGATAPPAAKARAVVVVVLDGVERAELPPWNPSRSPLTTLSELALAGTTFDSHRGPSTVISSVIASLLTGLPPRAHTVVDGGARLPESMTNLGEVARDASVRTAFFTGVPQTFRAFGFAHGWEKFVEHSPVAGTAATGPIDEAATWIADVARSAPEARMLVMVHARGAHPPWDVGPKELAAVPPPDYAGMIEPRRAAQVLARARQRRTGQALSPTDAGRVRALAALALANQDRALGALIAALRTANLWDDTLLLVTGDLGSGASEENLFAEGGPLREPLLSLPLWVHFPGGAHGGKRIEAPTEVYDLTRTAAAALGLTLPKEALGSELGGVAAGAIDPGVAPQVATIGDRYSARWGELVLSGRMDATPVICDLRVDATCAFDRSEVLPSAARAIFRRTVRFDLATRVPVEKREPATVDPDTNAALTVWGAGE